MTRRWKLAASSLISLLPLLLGGCDDPNAANAGNFEKALQEYYDAHPVCVSLPVALPLESSADLDDLTRRQLAVLASLGLVSATPPRTAAIAPSALGKARDDRRYVIAAAGEKSVRKGANSFLGGTDVCFAHRQIVKIDSFTQPVDEMGMTISNVTYDYDLKGLEAWTTDEKVQNAFPQIRFVLAKPNVTATDGVVLTGNGWRHEGQDR
jgi:hypothetical protein